MCTENNHQGVWSHQKEFRLARALIESANTIKSHYEVPCQAATIDEAAF